MVVHLFFILQLINKVSFSAALLVEGERRNLTPAVLAQETWQWAMFEWGAFTKALVRGRGGCCCAGGTGGADTSLGILYFGEKTKKPPKQNPNSAAFCFTIKNISESLVGVSLWGAGWARWCRAGPARWGYHLPGTRVLFFPLLLIRLIKSAVPEILPLGLALREQSNNPPQPSRSAAFSPGTRFAPALPTSG